MKDAVSKVVILGNGVAAAMAALAVVRAFGRLGVEVTWIEHGDPPPPYGALVALPDLATFHRLLGLEEARLVGGGATLNMGQQFVGWSGEQDSFVHAYGDAGTPFAALPFLQHWSRARRAGMNVALEDFSLAAAAAKQARVGQPQGDTTGQTVKHGFHLDAARYAAHLRAACQSAGVCIIAPQQLEFITDGERESAIAHDDGEEIEADLFIDAEGALIAAVDPDGETQHAPPCDRLIRASAPALDPLPPFSRIAAHETGWIALIPLADRTAVEFAYSSACLDDERATALLPRLAGRPILEIGPAQHVTGRRRPRPWVGNCVAIGPAAMDAPLLDGAELLLLQLAIAQLILLWPLARVPMPEANIYNEEMAGSQARIADFTHMHFRLNRRHGQPFWDAARAAPVDDALAAKIALFEARGMIAHLNHEAHVDDSWALCMTGHGLVPRSSDPQADCVEEQALMNEVRGQLSAVASSTRSMEVHESALQRMKVDQG